MSDFFGVLPSLRPAPSGARTPGARMPEAQTPEAPASASHDDAAEQNTADPQPQSARTRRGAGFARKRARPLPSGDLSAMGHLLS